MYSLETGIIVSIAAFFFLSFLTFVFLRERHITIDIETKIVSEENAYKKGSDNEYKPELVNNIISIINEGDQNDQGESNE